MECKAAEPHQEPTLSIVREKLYKIERKANELHRNLNVIHKILDEDINYTFGEDPKLTEKDNPKANLRFQMNERADIILKEVEKALEQVAQFKYKLVGK